MDDEVVISNGEILRRLNSHSDEIDDLKEAVGEIKGEQKAMAVRLNNVESVAGNIDKQQREALVRSNQILTGVIVSIAITALGWIWTVSRIAK